MEPRPHPPGTERGRGRPRDPRTDRAIVEAALQLLARDGYSRMTLEAVAAEAGVTKPTIYRRYADKADLATAALAQLAAEEPEPTTGDVHDDLVAALAAFRRSLLRPNGFALLGTVLAEEGHTPELIERFRERLLVPRRRRLRTLVERGIAEGVVRADADVEAAVNLLVGAFYARHLTGAGIPPTWPRRVVDTVWAGIAADAPPP